MTKSLSITSFLAIVALGLARAPRRQAHSVITALDIYHIGCIIFIFGTLLEFAVVHYLVVRKRRKRKKPDQLLPDKAYTSTTIKNPVYQGSAAARLHSHKWTDADMNPQMYSDAAQAQELAEIASQSQKSMPVSQNFIGALFLPRLYTLLLTRFRNFCFQFSLSCSTFCTGLYVLWHSSLVSYLHTRRGRLTVSCCTDIL